MEVPDDLRVRMPIRHALTIIPHLAYEPRDAVVCRRPSSLLSLGRVDVAPTFLACVRATCAQAGDDTSEWSVGEAGPKAHVNASACSDGGRACR
jgi:hypothetical protein